MLPYVGPVLMVLLLAKLFRPKSSTDYWWIHAIGFLEMALACVLNGDLVLAVFLMAYLACVLWSLSLFCLYREEAGQGKAKEEVDGCATECPCTRWEYGRRGVTPW